MQRLAEAIDQATLDGKNGLMNTDALRNAACVWASHTLITHDGDLLQKGLAISEALVGFCNEMERLRAPN